MTDHDPPATEQPATEAPSGAASERDDSAGAIFKRLGGAGWLGAAWLVMPAAMGFLLMGNMQTVADWMEPLPLWQRIGLYVSAFVVTSGFGLLPTYAQALLGGYLFGWMGVPAALGGFFGGSLIGYVTSRGVSQGKVREELARHPRASAVAEALIGQGFWKTLGIVTLVRVPPNSPFSLTNLVLTTSGVPKRVYAIGTLVGMAPRTAIAVWLGMRIEDWSQRDAPTWTLLVAVGSMVVVVAVIAHMANKAIERVTRRHASQTDSASEA